MTNPKPIGVCKLTGVEGSLVASHLIPRALTKPDRPGQTFIQGGQGGRPERRSTSWYDRTLVTEQGETILRDYDTWAIRELRKYRLIWDAWGPSKRLAAQDFHPIPDSAYGVRRIEGIDTSRLRLFFLSLLWRAAASSRYEFQEIELPEDHLEQLRKMIKNGDPDPIDFYPITLTQLSTRGPVHNQSPIAQYKMLPSFDGGPDREVPIFRFYFDGLVTHIHRLNEVGHTHAKIGPVAVGYDPTLLIPTVTFEASFQRENLKNLISEAHERWPDVMRRLYGMSRD